MRSMTERTDSNQKARRPLSQEMQTLLRDGDDGRPREVYMSVILSMEQHGWSPRSQVSALRNRANRGGSWYRITAKKHGPKAANAELVKMRAKALAFIAAHPVVGDRPEAQAKVAEIRADADAVQWPGRTGSTDRVVLEALLRMAALGGGPVFRASRRQIVQEANVTRRTVAKSLARLQDSGWLMKVRSASADQARHGRSGRQRALMHQSLSPEV